MTNALLVTTEKDFIRLDPAARHSIIPVPVHAVFTDVAALTPLLDRLGSRAECRNMTTEPAPAKNPSQDATAVPLGRRLRHYLEAAGFFLVMGFFRLFSIDRASAIGAWIGRNLVAPTPLSRRAIANLRQAFPEKNEGAIGAIIIAMWDNLAA